MIKFANFALFVLFTLEYAGNPALAQHNKTCDPQEVSMAVTPVPSYSIVGLKAADNVIAAPPTNADIVFVGDSILSGWREYSDVDFRGLKIWNFSVGGDRTQNILWRFENARSFPSHPKLAVILVGTNNLGDGLSACAVSYGIRAVVQKARSAWPSTPILLLGISPRGGDFKLFDKDRRAINGFLEEIPKLIADTRYVKFDDDRFTCGKYSKASLPSNILACYPEKAYACENYKSDNLHFSRVGYSSLRKMLLNAKIEEILGNMGE